MARTKYERSALRRYLLGAFTDAEEQQLELQLIDDSELIQEVETVQDELVQEYCNGELSTDERDKLYRRFLASPEGKRKLRFAKVLNRRVTRPSPPSLLSRLRSWLQNSFFGSPVAVLATVLIVVGLGVVVWRIAFTKSDVDKGLVALNNAYQQQRPIEARITKFDYAPFVNTRGAEQPKFNEAELRRAELLLLNARDKNPTPQVHYALGKFDLAKGDFDGAIEEFQYALKGDANNAQIYADLGAAYLETGKLEVGKGRSNPVGSEAGKGLEDFGRALENLNKALAINPNLLEALFNRALCEQNLTLYAKAEEDWRLYLQKDPGSLWADEARQNLKSLEDRRSGAAESEEQLRRDFLQAQGSQEIDRAWSALSRGQRRSGNAVFEKLIDDYLNLVDQGDGDSAHRQIQLMEFAAHVETKQAGDRFIPDLVKVYEASDFGKCELLAGARRQMKVANQNYLNNEFEEAIRIFKSAEELFTRLGDTPEALVAHSWIGYCYLRIPDEQESIKIFTELADQFEHKHYHSLRALTLTALGDASSGLNQFSKTLEYATLALEASEQVGDTTNIIRCLSQRVSTYLILNDQEKSLDAFATAANLAGTIPPDAKLTWPLYYEAALDFHFQGSPGTALAFTQESMALANTSQVPVCRSRSWERLGVIQAQQNDLVSAVESGKRALAEAQKIVGELSRKSMVAHSSLVLGELYASAGDAVAAISLFDKALGLYADLKLDAYSYRAHKGKLLGFLALHQDESAAAELDTVLKLFEDQRKKIIEESNRDKFFDDAQDTYDIAIDFAFSRQDYRKAFEYAEASRARSLFEMMSSGASPASAKEPDLNLGSQTVVPTVADIQNGIPADTQILEYAVLKNKILMWVITRSSVEGRQVTLSDYELDTAVHRYVQLLSQGTPESKEVISQGQQLHQALIQPVAELLDQKNVLCIVPDKSLNYLPFEALASASGSYLIEEFQIERSPSAAIFVRSSDTGRRKARDDSEAILSIGDPEFSKADFNTLTDLPDAAKEAKEIAAFYQSATVLTGTSATRDRVLDSLPKADVIHFATHALADDLSPLQSKIVLASGSGDGTERDGVIEAADIYALKKLRARLVVLSACQTGVERTYKGEGAIGLARPFTAVGVPVVVATLWPVESKSTAELMISFHRYRRLQHLSTARALQSAQLDAIRHQATDSQVKYSWAAFTVIGGHTAY